jgi:hypothetical protein
MVLAVQTLNDLDLGLEVESESDSDNDEAEVVAGPSNRQLARTFFVRVGPATHRCLLCGSVYAQVVQHGHGNLIAHLRGPHGDIFLALYQQLDG